MYSYVYLHSGRCPADEWSCYVRTGMLLYNSNSKLPTDLPWKAQLSPKPIHTPWSFVESLHACPTNG